MVIVKIEIWPHGSQENSRLLGLMKITNDLSGDKIYGNYDVVLSHAGKYINKEGHYKKARIEGYRRTLSPYHLVARALKACKIF